MNTAKEKVEWLKIRWMQFNKDSPFEIRYRYSHNALEAWKVLDVKRRQCGRPIDMGLVELPPLYTGPLSLKPNKLQDLQQLLEFIPPVHHAFYNALTSSLSAHSGTESDSEPED